MVNAAAVASGGPGPAPGNLNQLFFDAVEKFDKPDALMFRKDGAYQPISHRTLLEMVRRTGTGMQRLGIARGDRVAILSDNRPEWAVADLASLTAGFTVVPLYPSLPPDQIAHILRDSGASLIFVANQSQAEKLAGIRASLPSLRFVIGFSDFGSLADLSLESLQHKGAEGETEAHMAAYRSAALTARPDDVATIIYTSGTTGDPKGVMLTHDNIFSNVEGIKHAVPFTGSDVSLSFLPLSHIFERTGGHFLALATGTTIAYAESFDTVPVNMLEVRPTIVFSVPRLYEKIYARVLDNALSGGGVKKKIFFWARAVAEKWADVKLAGGTPGGLLEFKYQVAQRLVFAKLKARTGGRIRYFVSGAAPLAPEINKFFFAAGLTILEGYGLTETSPVISVNTPGEFRIGTVGRPIRGVEVMITPDLNEICTRGPHVMKGYFNKPAATAEAIDADGWFHTGDIGELRDGFLAITDRLKDIIVTAGGKNIAPQPIENRLKANKFVSQAVMIGDKRKYPVMLVIPDFTQLEKWAKSENIAVTAPAEFIRLAAVQAKMEKEVAAELAGLASFEMPKKVGLMASEFSAERGEITPTLKVKRRVVDKNYRELIDSLYSE